MTMFDNIMKRHNSAEGSANNLSHSDLLSKRAKALIEELVSPLSKPNQQIIDEVLMIISQTAHLPNSAVNKTEVQNITRTLLFQLVEPISNPNKVLIDELLSIVSGQGLDTNTGTHQGVAQKKEPSNQRVFGLNEPGDKQKLKGHYALSEQKSEAMAAAPYPSDGKSLADIQAQITTNTGNDKSLAVASNGNSGEVLVAKKATNVRHDKETRSVVNLILEQIKELITITNTLNTKLKSHQVRLDTYDDSITELKKKASDVDDRMSSFDKNMEKFIGLYEVVTNQYNPFIEGNNSFSGNISKVPSEPHTDVSVMSPGNNGHVSVVAKEPQPVIVEKVKPSVLVIGGTEVKSLHDFTDVILVMDDAKFEKEIVQRKNEIVNYCITVLGEVELSSIVHNVADRVSFIKDLMKLIHS